MSGYCQNCGNQHCICDEIYEIKVIDINVAIKVIAELIKKIDDLNPEVGRGKSYDTCLEEASNLLKVYTSNKNEK